MKKFLVTGSQGYIGQHMISWLMENDPGCAITVIDNSKGSQDWFNTVELTSYHDSKSFFETRFGDMIFDCVFHLASLADANQGMTSPFSVMDNNIVSTMVLSRLIKNGVIKTKSIVFASTASIDFYDIEEIMKPVAGVCPAYVTSKLINEQILNSLYIETGVPFVNLRYTNVAGRYGEMKEEHDPETHLIPKFMYRKFNDEFDVYNNGENIRDYVYVWDVCEANYKAYEKLRDGKPLGVLYVGSGQANTTLEVIDLCQKELLSRNEKPVVLNFITKEETENIRPADRQFESVLNMDEKLKHTEDMIGWKSTKNIEYIISTM